MNAPVSTVVERPTLPDVLAVLTGVAPAMWRMWLSPSWSGGVMVTTMDDRGVRQVLVNGSTRAPHGLDPSWSIKDPQAALEALTTAGVLPESWAQDERRGFWCPTCKGSGDTTPGDGGAHWDGACFRCLATGSLQVPVTIPELVAWASLGRDAIARAEALSRETVARLKEWGAPQPDRVVWRVGPWRLAADTMGRGPAGDPWPTPIGWPTDRLFPGPDGSWISGPDEWWEKQVALWDRESPCPFAPMVALKETGTWVEAITADALTLCVRPIT